MSSSRRPPGIVAALYKFVRLPDYRQIQPRLLNRCRQLALKGTLLLAEEGINGTLAGSRQAIDLLLAYLYQDERFLNLEYKESVAADFPFRRLKVKLRPEIVTMGVPNIDPTRLAAQRCDVNEWNRVLADSAVRVIDIRNRYEYRMGTFRNAIPANIDCFRQFPEYVNTRLNPNRDEPIAMFCTGGIRCEKAGAFMLRQGFKQVYQLNGGILRYLQQVPRQENLWQGDCFVFDGRSAVNKNLQAGGYEQSVTRSRPGATAAPQSPSDQPGESYAGCDAVVTGEQRAQVARRQTQRQAARQCDQDSVGADSTARSIAV